MLVPIPQRRELALPGQRGTTPAVNTEERVSTGYSPHPLQREFHLRMKRFNAIVCHRRFGKTVMAVNTLVSKCVKSTVKAPRFSYVAPFRSQAKEIAWDYVKEFTRPIPGATYNESELRVDFAHNGGRLMVRGADNPDSIRGKYSDGTVLDEAAQMKPVIWGEIVRPMIADRGGWVIFSGTPKGVNLFHDVYHRNLGDPDWYCVCYPVAQTLRFLPWLSEEEILSARSQVSDSQARQEWDCDWNASSDDTLITIDLITAAKGKHLRPSDYSFAPIVVGVDVARYGDDRSSICIRQGLACFEPLIFNDIDNMSLADQVMRVMDKYQPRSVFIDAGRGEGVIDRCRQCGYQVIEVPFGSSKTSEPLYLNRRIEMWHRAKRWLMDGGALPANDQLCSDLVVPTYDFNDAGKMRLEKKKKMKERVGRSPDVGDSFALTFANIVRNSARRHVGVSSNNADTRNLRFTNNDYQVLP